MTNGQKAVAGILAIAFIVGGAVIAEKYFLPEQATQVNEELPENTAQEQQNTDPQTDSQQTPSEETDSTRVLKSGEFTGKTGHTVKGTVKIVDVDGEKYLRFENYTQTQGPDVFVYLTPSNSPESNSEISEGRKIRIDGGPDGGEITKEGNFNQKLPEDIDVSKYNGVGIWCDAFSTPFGTAELKQN